MRYVKYSSFIFLFIFCVLLLWSFLAPRKVVCKAADLRLTISTITYGEFVEFIPQTGIYDTTKGSAQITIPIDELYFDRMELGLIGTTTADSKDYLFTVTRVDSTVQNGRFTIEAKFQDDQPKVIHGASVRVRLRLNDPIQARLLPVGGFYKDTGGEWLLVLQNDGTVVKRPIKLGKKNIEHFVVLDGLNVGDRVITSSYENFVDDEDVDFDEVKDELNKLANKIK
jgi:hypothetical protein